MTPERDPPAPLRLGFACLWAPDPEAMWSCIPWQLRAALRRTADLVDVGVTLPPPVRHLLRGLHARWWDGRLRSTWNTSFVTTTMARAAISRTARRSGCEAVVEITDMAPVRSLPYFVFHDLSFDLLLERYDRAAGTGPYLEGVPLATVERWRRRQHRILSEAAGVFAMSKWLADDLVVNTGLAAERVHVVHPGASAASATTTTIGLPSARPQPRRKLLFVGSSFHSKGGPAILEALAILQSSFDRELTLTIAGPRDWRPTGAEPPGVQFVGKLPLAEVARLFQTHDLFVMPSRFEAFGIVFAEALSFGLPCVGRRLCAMPEIIEPGRNGALVDDADPEELAAAIAGLLANDAVFEHCRAEAPAVASYYSWDRAASQIVDIVERTLGGKPISEAGTRR